MSIAAPKQMKFLGAQVRGVGLVVAVSSTLAYGYAIVEGPDKVTRRVALSNLKRDEVTLPTAPVKCRLQTERVGYGTWDEVYSLIPAAPVVVRSLRPDVVAA